MKKLKGVITIEKFYGESRENMFFQVTTLDSNGRPAMGKYRLDDKDEVVFVKVIKTA